MCLNNFQNNKNRHFIYILQTNLKDFFAIRNSIEIRIEDEKKYGEWMKMKVYYNLWWGKAAKNSNKIDERWRRKPNTHTVECMKKLTR